MQSTAEVLASGGYDAVAAKIGADNQTIDFSKQSSTSTLFSQSEIDTAIAAAKQHYISGNNLLINIWYDNDAYLELSEEYKKNSLYGMDQATARGDLIILYSDIYFFEKDVESLALRWKIILARENKDTPWEVIDQGY